MRTFLTLYIVFFLMMELNRENSQSKSLSARVADLL